MTTPSPLAAISPIDGRYRSQIEDLAWIASEQALHRFRVQVEIEWFLHLAASPEIPDLPGPGAADAARLRLVYQEFSGTDAEHIVRLERTTNHDVKAVEYFVKDRLASIRRCRSTGNLFTSPVRRKTSTIWPTD